MIKNATQLPISDVKHAVVFGKGFFYFKCSVSGSNIAIHVGLHIVIWLKVWM